MQLPFDIAGRGAVFERSALTGRAILRTGDDVIRLQSPYWISTYFEFRTTREWRCRVGGNEVTIVKVRPVAFAGFRPNSFTVLVDGAVFAEASGGIGGRETSSGPRMRE